MREEDFPDRMEALEKNVRNIRIAVIIIAAFFLYETIAPSGLGKGDLRVMNTVKLKELVILDSENREQIRMYADEEGGQLVLNSHNDVRLHLTGEGVSAMLPSPTGYVEHLRIDNEGVSAYDRSGSLIGTLRSP